MDKYPLALYRSGSEFEWDGKGADSLTVDNAEEHEAALADGWKEAGDYLKPADKPKPAPAPQRSGKPAQ